MSAQVSVDRLVKRFEGHAAVDGVTFTVPAGAFATILGPSGCGKTTTIRIIAGLEDPDAGEVMLGSETVTAPDRGILVPPENRRVGMIFQSYALWPHMTVFENVAFPLRMARVGRAEMRRRVDEVLALVKLEGLEQRLPLQLSGGQQQRVALARALAPRPRVLLLDEPLSNLDARLRESMRFELREMQRRLGITTIYVTHDQVEALQLSDLVAVMSDGRMLQVGRPEEVYHHPANETAAEFLGAANLFTGARVKGVDENDHLIADTPLGPVHAHGAVPGIADTVSLCVRPHEIRVSAARPPATVNVFPGHVQAVSFLGETFEYTVLVGDTLVKVRAGATERLEVGQDVWITVPAAAVRVLNITAGRR